MTTYNQRLKAYESAKRQLQYAALSSEEYEIAIKKLVEKYKI